ncbi:hypothetical protein GCM10010320_78900 [Streptomyces caelestis]|nr:hypothetical protein GCM10010320_78900 [Streptomyces caelestis]
MPRRASCAPAAASIWRTPPSCAPSTRARQPFLEGYVTSMRIVFLTGAAVSLVAFVLAAWRVPDLTLSDE